jgi:pseudaminic acid cytidylyltransferase
MKIAIIPARGGSKRIPNKNIRDFCGRPMIAHSIASAQASGVFDRIVVSTDSREISEIARKEGAEVPFERPAEISGDHATTAEVIRHTISMLQDPGRKPEHFCCLYATAPLLAAEDLRKSYEAMIHAGAECTFSVAAFSAPVLRALKIDAAGRLQMAWPEHELTRSNDLPAFYHDAGQFYWHRTDAFMKHGKIWGVSPLPYVLPRSRVQDIDTEEDWEIAESLYRIYGFQHRPGQTDL